MSTTLIVLGLVAVIFVWFAAIYNKLVKGKTLVKEGWSGVDVQLKRRYDLIPNLVETVKGYSQHEKGLFEEVANLRSRSMNAGTLKEKGEAEAALSNTLKSLFAVAEAYPELKANQNFMELQKALYDTEEQIQLSRRYYNGTVRNYNIIVEAFPSNIVASMFKFGKEEFFGVESEAVREAPKVGF